MSELVTEYTVTNTETGRTWKRKRLLETDLKKGSDVLIGFRLYTVEEIDHTKRTVSLDPGVVCDQ